GLAPAVRDADLMTGSLEESSAARRGVAVVIGHQQPQWLYRHARLFDRRMSGLPDRRVSDGQPHHELASMPHALAVRVHGAAVQLHESPYQRESNAEPAFRALEGRRRLRKQGEHPRHHLRGYADAVVPDLHQQIPALAPGLELDAPAAIGVLGG